MSAGARHNGPDRAARLRPAWPRAARHRDPQGQALVEFAAVLMPVLLIVVGIIQFGLLFGANVTLTNAARESARAGSIYLYDRSHTKAWNDAARCGAMVTAAKDAFGLLDAAAPHFTTTLTGGACDTPVGEGQTNGDLTIAYCDHMGSATAPCPDPLDPTTTCTLDNRMECLVRVQLTYHADIIVPLIGNLLSTDVNGRFAMRSVATMVIQ
jgi:Flp pilus assembly protein TadG